MGRYSYSSKDEADDLKKISTSFLKKHDYFCGMRSGTMTWTHGRSGDKSSVGIEVRTISGDQYLRIHYTQTEQSGEKKDFDYKIPLTSTACNYGGMRWWFICPMNRDGKYCGRRVGTIYKNGDLFACRHCYDLTYASKKVNRSYKHFALFNVLEVEMKTEELESQIKRRYYAGKPTRKQRKLNRLYTESYGSFQRYKEAERRGIL
jgi:hypothetical protein